MKVNGKSIVRETREVTLPRSKEGEELKFVVSSITIGVKRDFEVIFPRPRVPKIVTQGKNGREEKEDWSDAKFIEQMDERSMLQNIYLLYRVLEADPNVEFDNIPKDKESLKALASEIKATGLSEGDIVILLREALLASNLTQEEIDKVKGDF